MIHTDLIPADKHATQPSARGQKCYAEALQSENDRAGTDLRLAPECPGSGEQKHGREIEDHVLCRSPFPRTLWWYSFEIIDESRDGRDQGGHDPGETQIASGGPPRRTVCQPAGKVEEERAIQERKRERNQRGVNRMAAEVGCAAHAVRPPACRAS